MRWFTLNVSILPDEEKKKDVLMFKFRLKNSDFDSIFFLFRFFIYSIYIFLYVILCMYITYMGMQLQSASPVFVCVGETDTILFATAHL